MGSVMKAFFPDQPIWTMLTAAVVMAVAAMAMLGVEAKDPAAHRAADADAPLATALNFGSGESN
jgi:maltose/moltooligosaccharide transporter